ncbi:MAG: gliding motility-associated C-terminal domain-containing protein [Deltaproteobacteria bacterium]|nr:gliding motility-associated C-terminal domain-containing protein [Deltaproteobacteria bacterium]
MKHRFFTVCIVLTACCISHVAKAQILANCGQEYLMDSSHPAPYWSYGTTSLTQIEQVTFYAGTADIPDGFEITVNEKKIIFVDPNNSNNTSTELWVGGNGNPNALGFSYATAISGPLEVIIDVNGVPTLNRQAPLPNFPPLNYDNSGGMVKIVVTLPEGTCQFGIRSILGGSGSAASVFLQCEDFFECPDQLDIVQLTPETICDSKEIAISECGLPFTWVSPSGVPGSGTVLVIDEHDGPYHLQKIYSDNCIVTGEVTGSCPEEPIVIEEAGDQNACAPGDDYIYRICEPAYSDAKITWRNAQGEVVGTGTEISTSSPEPYSVQVTYKNCDTTADTEDHCGEQPLQIEMENLVDNQFNPCGTVLRTCKNENPNAIHTITHKETGEIFYQNEIIATQPGQYDFEVKHANNCSSQASVTLNDEGKVTITAGQFDKCHGQELSICQPASENVQVRWIDPDGETVAENQNSIQAFKRGEYTVQLFYPFGGYTMEGTFETTFTEPIAEGGLFFPTAFSPNGDGKNDQYRIKGLNTYVNYFNIYNRWGKRVFTFSGRVNGDNLAWDGTDQTTGKAVPEGVYVYTIDFEVGPDACNPSDGQRRGSITLIR